jgi:hypothetical protein
MLPYPKELYLQRILFLRGKVIAILIPGKDMVSNGGKI